MAGVYIHIPFCRQACFYCNFHFSTSRRYQAPMVAALKKELVLRKEYLGGRVLRTIYFGGGTPSQLPVEEIELLLNTVKTHFEWGDEMEITLEGNPEDLTLSYLQGLHGIGINRLSIGVQSFDSDTLKSLNRAHDASQARRSIQDARRAGFDNFSVDLMYGLPTRKRDDWAKELGELVGLSPPHISAYCLTIEPGTVFAHRKRTGTFSPVSEEREVAEFRLLRTYLMEHGYTHYELSNFCQEPYYAVHNRSYWQQKPYLGIGPSAHSYDGQTRQHNIAHNKHYLDAILRSEVPARKEQLSRVQHIREYILLGLRTQWGIDLARLKEEYNYDLVKEKKEVVSSAEAQGFLLQKGDSLLPTEKGLLLADELTERLSL